MIGSNQSQSRGRELTESLLQDLNDITFGLSSKTDFDKSLTEVFRILAGMTGCKNIILLKRRSVSTEDGPNFQCYLRSENLNGKENADQEYFFFPKQLLGQFTNAANEPNKACFYASPFPRKVDGFEKAVNTLKGDLSAFCSLFYDDQLIGFLLFLDKHDQEEWSAIVGQGIEMIAHPLARRLALEKMEQHILEETVLNQHILSTIPQYIVLLEPATGETTYLNLKEEFTFLGYKVKDIDDQLSFFMSKIHPEDLTRTREQFFDKLSTIGDANFLENVYRIKCAEGSWNWVSQRAKVFRRNPDGTVKEILITLADVTEQRRMQLDAIEKNRKYQEFVSHTQEGIYFMNCGQPIPLDWPLEKKVESYYEHAYIEECNDALARMYGLESASELLNKKVVDFHKGEHFEQNSDSFRLFVKKNYRVDNVETIEQDASGAYKYFLNNAVGIIQNEKLIGIWGTTRDITPMKAAENALRESEERLEMAIASTKLGAWEWDFKNSTIEINDNWANMLGYRVQELQPRLIEKIVKMIHPEDIEKVRHAINDNKKNKTDFFEVELRFMGKDGKYRWIYSRGKIIAFDKDGEPLKVIGVNMDITDRMESEISLREREALFRNLFEESPLGIAVSDSEGNMIRINNQFSEMLGYSEEELLQLNFRKITHPDDVGKEMKLFFKTIKNRQTMAQMEKRYIHKNGDIIWVSLSLSLVYNKNWEVNTAIAMVENITEKQEAIQALREGEALQKAMLNALPDLKFRLSYDGKIINYYPSSNESNDLYAHPEEFLGHKLGDILPPHVATAIESNTRKSIDENVVRIFEYALVVKNKVNYYEARFSPINDKEAVAIVRNISERKKAQESVKEKIRELDVKNRQLQEYIDSNMQLENFAYIASHDLREPVRTMRTFAQLIKKRYGSQLDESANTYIDFIVDSAINMNQLIEDLLTYSRVNTEEHDKTDINLNNLAGTIIEEMNNAIVEKNAKVIIEPLPSLIRGNPTKLKQLFQNLIANSIKFSREEEQPVVRLKGKDLSTHWQFSIEDNGIGISPQFHDQIFLLFKKLHNRADYQGTGLGLAICKKIVEQHGGTIWVESEKGEGATFFFTIKKDL